MFRLSGFDGVVPLTVDVGGLDVELRHLCVCHFDAFIVGILVEPSLDGQALRGRRAGDKLDDDLMRRQGFATRVPGDEGKQAMLDAVPSAGARRQMGHRDGQTRPIGQGLRFGFP